MALADHPARDHRVGGRRPRPPRGDLPEAPRGASRPVAAAPRSPRRARSTVAVAGCCSIAPAWRGRRSARARRGLRCGRRVADGCGERCPVRIGLAFARHVQRAPARLPSPTGGPPGEGRVRAVARRGRSLAEPWGSATAPPRTGSAASDAAGLSPVGRRKRGRSRLKGAGGAGGARARRRRGRGSGRRRWGRTASGARPVSRCEERGVLLAGEVAVGLGGDEEVADEAGAGGGGSRRWRGRCG